MIRIYDFMSRYIHGESYESCLQARDREYLIALKEQGYFSLDEAREVAYKTMKLVTELADDYCNTHVDAFDPKTEALLQDVQYSIMERSVKIELSK